jgi:hypothetical protein
VLERYRNQRTGRARAHSTRRAGRATRHRTRKRAPHGKPKATVKR